jgi:Fic family protein
MMYQRIQPFPTSGKLQFPELRALTSVWRERKSTLEDSGAYKEFIKKLQREWAIETGIIERLYTWDRGVTETLIEQGIESSIIAHGSGLSKRDADDIKIIINDHLKIVEGLFGYVKGEEPLSEHFIRGLHAQFTAHQDHTEAINGNGDWVQVPLIRGEYKKLPNNPRCSDGVVHIYAPPVFVQEEMGNLVRLYREADSLYEPEVKAAWLHHRFTQIHPFQDGNGRVARTLASLIFIRENLFPLVVRESDREKYIGALKQADRGNLDLLVEFFVHRQRESILKVLGLYQQAQESKYADQIISSALQVLRGRFSKEQEKISVVYEYADKLFKDTIGKFNDLVSKLNPELRSLTPPNGSARLKYYGARMNNADNNSEHCHYFYKQIVEIAKKFDYFASFDSYRAWVRMTLATDQEFDVVVSFHGYGLKETGILAASAFTYLKVSREEGGTEPVALHSAAVDIFQFNYIEAFETQQERFLDWLENITVIALAEWDRFLKSGV